MNLIHFQSEPPRTAFAPEWSYIMGEDIIEGIDFAHIARYVLEKEKEIIEKYPPENFLGKPDLTGYTGLGENTITARYDHYNFFGWDDFEIKKLKGKVVEKYYTFLESVNVKRENVWIKCWANVMRKGEKINPHLHQIDPFCYLGGHLMIQCQDTSTFYVSPINQINAPITYESKNQVGKVTFFQNNIPHYSSTHEADSERIGIAFDLIVEEDYRRRSQQERSNLIIFDKVNS